MSFAFEKLKVYQKSIDFADTICTLTITIMHKKHVLPKLGAPAVYCVLLLVAALATACNNRTTQTQDATAKDLPEGYQDLLYIPEEAYAITYYPEDEDSLAPGAGVSYNLPPAWDIDDLDTLWRQEVLSRGWKPMEFVPEPDFPGATEMTDKDWFASTDPDGNEYQAWLQEWEHPEKDLVLTSQFTVWADQDPDMPGTFVGLNIVGGEEMKQRLERYRSLKNSTEQDPSE